MMSEMATRTTAIVRHGALGTKTRGWVISAMGSHLSGNVHAGRWARDEARSMAASR